MPLELGYENIPYHRLRLVVTALPPPFFFLFWLFHSRLPNSNSILLVVTSVSALLVIYMLPMY